MKSEKIISGIKTAGVVLTAALTMNSCGSKQLSEKEQQTVQHKTDSAAYVHPEYRMAAGLIELGETKIKSFRDANKTLLKMGVKDFIRNNVKDAEMARFMCRAIDDEKFVFSSNSGIDSDSTWTEDANINSLSTMRRIRCQQRWYNDLLLYLSDKYTEQQLLKSNFFKVINNKDLQKSFEYNTQQIENIKSCMEFPLQREKTIRAELWNKYASEAVKQR